MPARVEVRDFVSRRFQLRFQVENLRARFRIKIRCGKGGFQIRPSVAIPPLLATHATISRHPS